MSEPPIDVAIVGAGAAGLTAGIFAARSAPPGARVCVLEGARRIGMKILISGGGRCNITHQVVSERDFAGATPNAIRKVLKGFDLEATRRFFSELGVEFDLEAETGKYFPTTNRARTVLDALLGGLEQAGGELVHPFRVQTLERSDDGFALAGPDGALMARRVILATGGKSIPKTGSDGHGFTLAQQLGHGLTPLLTPSLAPLLLPDDHPYLALKGIALPAALFLEQPSGKQLHRSVGALLLTHFGLSGPVALDVSRHFMHETHADPSVRLCVSWCPDERPGETDAWLRAPGSGPVLAHLQERFPRRLAETFLALAGLGPTLRRESLGKDKRRALLRALTHQVLPVTDTRGFRYAEATAGGIPLREVHLATMASRLCPGLSFCGEILDVDGRIGGFNFQWAWSSAHAAGASIWRTPVEG